MKNSFAWSCVIRLKRCSGLARGAGHCRADEVDGCTEWARVLVSHPVVITARQAFYTTLRWCHPIATCTACPWGHKSSCPRQGSGQHTLTFIHTASCSWACSRHSRAHMCTHTVTFMQKHTQTHPLPRTQTHEQCVQKSRTFGIACLQAPRFSGKDLAFHKHPSVCLYKLPGCANSTWALMSESALCQWVCPSNSTKVVDKTG